MFIYVFNNKCIVNKVLSTYLYRVVLLQYSCRPIYIKPGCSFSLHKLYSFILYFTWSQFFSKSLKIVTRINIKCYKTFVFIFFQITRRFNFKLDLRWVRFLSKLIRKPIVSASMKCDLETEEINITFLLVVDNA